MNTALIIGGAAVAQAQPEDPDLCIGRLVAVHPEITPPPPPDRLNPGQLDSARLGIGDRLISSHHQCTGRRQFVVARSEKTHEPKKIPKQFTRIQRSVPHFLDFDAVNGVQSYRKFGNGFHTSTRSSPTVLRRAAAKVTTALQQKIELFKVTSQDQVRTSSSSNT